MHGRGNDQPIHPILALQIFSRNTSRKIEVFRIALSEGYLQSLKWERLGRWKIVNFNLSFQRMKFYSEVEKNVMKKKSEITI